MLPAIQVLHVSSALAPDSCQGFGPPGNPRRRSAPALPVPAAALLSSEPAGAASPPKRLAIELTGCVRSLALSMPHKLLAIAEAQNAGFAVDLYCVLHSCVVASDTTAVAHELEAVHNLSSQFRSQMGTRGGEVVNCSYSSYEEGSLTASANLRSPLTARHPDYPYARWRRVDTHNLDRTLAQAHKWQQVAAMRSRVGRSYDLVWRQRPDYVSTGLNFRSVATRLLAANSGEAYAVPSICVDGAHTDIEALLTSAAADHYDALFTWVPSLYTKSGSANVSSRSSTGNKWQGPEVLLDEHMRRGGFRYLYLHGSKLYRCSPFCFGTALPCRQLGGFKDDVNPHACTPDAPLRRCHADCGPVRGPWADAVRGPGVH